MSEKVRQGRLVVISGPSGVGKGTLIEALRTLRDDLAFSVSCTTREPREQEQDGVHYFFISQQEFHERIQAGDFLEYAGYADNAYGTSRSQVNGLLAQGKTVILDIESKGAMQVRTRCPDATLIYILPPSYQELARRLYGRQTESEEKIQKRLRHAKKECADIPKYDYVVVNREVGETVQELNRILDAIAYKSCYMQEPIDRYCASFPEEWEEGAAAAAPGVSGNCAR